MLRACKNSLGINFLIGQHVKCDEFPIKLSEISLQHVQGEGSATTHKYNLGKKPFDTSGKSPLASNIDDVSKPTVKQEKLNGYGCH